MRHTKQQDIAVFNGIGVIVVVFFTVFCVLPFLYILAGSFTDEQSIYKYGYRLVPKVFSVSAYEYIFKNPKPILSAYGVTLSITVVGTIVGLFLMAMGAYVLQRKDFKYRNKIMFFIFFTTLFQGGLVPWYILMVRYLHLKDSYLALLLPLMMNVFNMIILRSFMKTIPEEISESAKTDGAGDFSIFIKLILPMAKPGLATIGMFMALAYWNDWFHAMLFIDDPNKYPLQFLLYKILKSSEFVRKMATSTNINVNTPSETYKLATSMIVTGPIILLYPFVQRFFIKGLTIGAVKG